jgi:hypothetical protein
MTTPEQLPVVTPIEFSRTHAVLTVDITPHLTNIAFTTRRTRHRGRLNVWGNSLPADTVSDRLAVDGVVFAGIRATGREPDNIRCAGQYLDLPERIVDWLHLLATSERRCEEIVHLHYASGEVDPEWLRVSDFWPSQAHFGERLAVRTTAMHYPRHRQDNLGGQLWAIRIPVRRHQPVRGLRLPDNPALHVFALSMEEVR